MKHPEFIPTLNPFSSCQRILEVSDKFPDILAILNIHDSRNCTKSLQGTLQMKPHTAAAHKRQAQTKLITYFIQRQTLKKTLTTCTSDHSISLVTKFI